MTDIDTQSIRRLYDCFNARDIDGVLAMLTADVAWANGMDGGHVHGHAALRDYWTRQWAMVSPHVEPVAFKETEDGHVAVAVIQTVRSRRDTTPGPDARIEGQDGNPRVSVHRGEGRAFRHHSAGLTACWCELKDAA